jgi:PAS domain S-box-containing protein
VSLSAKHESPGVATVGQALIPGQPLYANSVAGDREQEIQKLRLVIDTIPALVHSALPDGSIDYFNQSWLSYFGSKLEDVTGWRWTSRVHPDEVEEFVGKWRAALALGKPFEAESRVRRADGEYRWLLHQKSPLRDERGNVIRWYGSSIDIEDRKRAQDRLQTAIDATPAFILSALPDGFIDYFNKGCLDYLGVSLEDIKGWRWPTVVHPDDAEASVSKWRDSVASGEPYEIESRIRRADGEYRWFFHRRIPLRHNERNIIRWYGTSVEIEDRKRAQEKLRQSEAYLAEAQALSGTGCFGMNVSTGELFWSDETFRILAYERSIEPTLEHVFKRVHPEDVAFVKKAFDAAFAERKFLDLEHRILLPDGSIKYLHVVSHPIEDVAGNLEYIGAVKDFTVRKIAFEEIHALKEQLYKENIVLREEVDKGSMFEEIVGSSTPLQCLLAQVARVAPTNSTVLITGETGTGKELVARAIHRRSSRGQHAFVSVNCSAIAPSLISSELFGHEKGAFTGATQRRMGRFELADGGTIFLDEVGELPAETQIALLRVLQEREFERVGGSQTVSVNVRVLAATNRDLKEAIESGTFRRDLFYRLNVFPIQMPPLRERAEDIPLLVQYFAERYASNMGKKIRTIDRSSMELLRSYAWPGNIRELQNVIERAVILSDGESLSIEENWLQSESEPSLSSSVLLSTTLMEREREMIEATLAKCRGRVAGASGAAAKLGIPRQTLDSRIKSLGIDKHRYKS